MPTIEYCLSLSLEEVMWVAAHFLPRPSKTLNKGGVNCPNVRTICVTPFALAP